MIYSSRSWKYGEADEVGGRCVMLKLIKLFIPVVPGGGCTTDQHGEADEVGGRCDDRDDDGFQRHVNSSESSS